jgi:hypothetical protein
MSPLDAALRYAAHGWPVFPCQPDGPRRKQPMTGRGFYDASTDSGKITTWWRRCPLAFVGVPTGEAIGAVVLDVDAKDPAANGFDSLDDLGHAILPETPMSHTASGGLHVFFANPERELKCSVGLLGPGLDVRATGGYIIAPTPDSGYHWDLHWNFRTVAPVIAPEWLWPPKLSRPVCSEPIRPVNGLSPYGAAAIEGACDAIAKAGPGLQERTLNAECFSIGTLAGAGGIPAAIALAALLRAGHAMQDHDPRYPWRTEEIDLKVRRAFNAGMANPREARRAVA